MQEQEIKVSLCPYHKSNKSHRCLVLENHTMTEDIYLHNNDCNENNAECVLLQEFIHTILYHFLDEEKFQSLLPKLINDKIDLNDYMKKELISSKYDNPSKLYDTWVFNPWVFIQSSENWFSSLLEDWNFQGWNTVDYLMKIRWKE